MAEVEQDMPEEKKERIIHVGGATEGAGRHDRGQQEERMEKVRDYWARGIRNVSFIAKEMKINHMTIKRDLITIRRRIKREPMTDFRRSVMREEVAAGYFFDIRQCQEMIDELRKEKKKKLELTQMSSGEGNDGEAKPESVKRKQVTEGVDYNLITKLVRQKLDAREKIVELYDLIVPEGHGPMNLPPININNNINASATAAAITKTDYDLSGINDHDVINTSKSILAGIVAPD